MSNRRSSVSQMVPGKVYHLTTKANSQVLVPKPELLAARRRMFSTASHGIPKTTGSLSKPQRLRELLSVISLSFNLIVKISFVSNLTCFPTRIAGKAPKDASHHSHSPFRHGRNPSCLPQSTSASIAALLRCRD